MWNQHRLPATIALVSVITLGVVLTTWSVFARVPVGAQPALNDKESESRSDSSTPNSAPPKTHGEYFASTSVSPPTALERRVQQSPFTITWTYSKSSTDGQVRTLQISKRYQRSDGAFKLTHSFQNQNGSPDRVETIYGFLGLGAFRLDQEGERLIFLGPIIDEQTSDVEAALRADPRFDRTENVEGQHTIVWRTVLPHDAGFIEEYRAPALGGILLKRVEDSPRGRQFMEPTSIETGEPNPALFDQLTRYPPDYTRYERDIERTERDQQHDAARLMKELMRRMKAVRPGRH